MRPLALYARSRGIPASLVALPVVALASWWMLHDPWTTLGASLTALAAVLVVTTGLAGQDPELDASTALPWPVWRLGHLLVAAVLAAVAMVAVQQFGDVRYELAFIVRDAAGLTGLAGLTAAVAGARMAAVAPVLWWAVAAIMPPGDSLTWRITTWPLGSPDDAVTQWIAAVLFVTGLAAYALRGGRR
ncbi:hypothetical protein SAMN05216553_103169 [Lentzea fradiae]|uniref:Uncharacterized protein n=1 Tax=Lentzea fradiae TaxID=200378 RepID=A0A1G7NR48_9PSEU|nr:hypothetical protein [Lentzea fradiae]SDF76555.1 hypothetical protein SAMN05216553_103169 [Lentzea fradiae]